MPVFFSTRFIFFSIIFPLLVSIVLYRLDSFDPSPFPAESLVSSTTSIPPLLNDRFLTGAEFIGVGLLNNPEDIAYHKDTGLIYTGCVDGWVKRVSIHDSANDSVVEDWVNTGGRPLGIAFGLHGEVIVADANMGLLNISDDGKKTELLTEEAEGVRFKLTDAVAVADNGVLYFTDASYKYNISQFAFDFLEGKPHGRLMSFDPITRVTRVLRRDLYFANGVSMSPDQTHLIFCETVMRRCTLIPLSEFSDAAVMKKYALKPDAETLDIVNTAARKKSITVVMKIYWGDPREKICAAADQIPLSSLVMGNRGLGGLKRMIMGSVSNHVVNTVACPVTVVKTHT